jgi:hypothetical protein
LLVLSSCHFVGNMKCADATNELPHNSFRYLRGARGINKAGLIICTRILFAPE